MDFYWESSIQELRRRTSIGDSGAAIALTGRLFDENFNGELVVTTIAQMIAKPHDSIHEPHWEVEFDEDYVFVGSYA